MPTRARRQKTAETIARMHRALEMRESGATDAEIGAALGILRDSVSSVITRARRELPKPHDPILEFAVSGAWR